MYVSVASSLARSVLHRRRRFEKFLSVNPVFICRANTSSFTFPPHTNPTPHEIFHLPHTASQDEIKARYYELVKVYHPDASDGQHDVSPSVRNAQFRAITHAYGILRGRTGLSSKGGTDAWDYHDEAMRAELRRRSRRSRSSSSSTTTAANNVRHENTDDAQVWFIVALFLVGAIAAMSSVSSHMERVERHTQSAAANLAQARAEAQLYGMERRRKIRERVRSYHDARETLDESGRPEGHATSKLWQAIVFLTDSGEVDLQALSVAVWSSRVTAQPPLPYHWFHQSIGA
ncbi:hypothetical protein V8E55_005386 [Tylopilus felleus]